MDLSPNQTPRAPRRVPACPWCGPGTELALCYDKMGGVQLSCVDCECIGPKVAITDSFADAEEAAIGMWSQRRLSAPIGQETLARVKLAIGLHCLTGKLTSEAIIGIAWLDLNALLKTFDQPGRPAGG